MRLGFFMQSFQAIAIWAMFAPMEDLLKNWNYKKAYAVFCQQSKSEFLINMLAVESDANAAILKSKIKALAEKGIYKPAAIRIDTVPAGLGENETIAMRQAVTAKNAAYHRMKDTHGKIKALAAFLLQRTPFDGEISLRQLLIDMEQTDSAGNPIPFDLAYLTKAGQWKEYSQAVLYKNSIRGAGKNQRIRKTRTKAQFWKKTTREILDADGQLKSININLIIGFNGKEVQWI